MHTTLIITANIWKEIFIMISDLLKGLITKIIYGLAKLSPRDHQKAILGSYKNRLCDNTKYLYLHWQHVSNQHFNKPSKVRREAIKKVLTHPPVWSVEQTLSCDVPFLHVHDLQCMHIRFCATCCLSVFVMWYCRVTTSCRSPLPSQTHHRDGLSVQLSHMLAHVGLNTRWPVMLAVSAHLIESITHACL